MTAARRRSGRPGPSPFFDREEILPRIDLVDLADELLGGRVGNGRSAKWPSPVPGHPQTGASPPMSVFRASGGVQLWKCFATGASGSAIDLVMLVTGRDVRQAVEWLAHRAGASAVRRPSPPVARPRVGVAPTRVNPRVEAYVATCERLLWRSEGRAALEWLTKVRRFDEATLRANRVGFDPGPDGFRRPAGLPHLGEAVVLPVLGERGRAVYFQTRYLDPGAAGRKYDNPGVWLAPNPKVANIRTPCVATGHDELLLVTEGIPDALSAASAGYRSVAVLGTSNTGFDAVIALAPRPEILVLAFDRDDAGRHAAGRLVNGLADAGRTYRVVKLVVPEPFNDLNEWFARGTEPITLADCWERRRQAPGYSFPSRCHLAPRPAGVLGL